MCAIGIDFLSFYDFAMIFYNCSDSVIFNYVFFLILLQEKWY